VTKFVSLIRNLSRPRPRGPAVEVAMVRLLLNGAVLLAQLQLVWLAGFHYHAEVTLRQSSSAAIACNALQGSPVDDGGSCPFCQLVRHSTSSPPSSITPFFDSTSNNRITPLVQTEPLAASHVRLAGRDPPSLSLLTNC
jgi:hypothetical protein